MFCNLQGLNPSLGMSSGNSDEESLRQLTRAKEIENQDLAGSGLIKQEEVLMYHRSASRLYEICQ